MTLATRQQALAKGWADGGVYIVERGVAMAGDGGRLPQHWTRSHMDAVAVATDHVMSEPWRCTATIKYVDEQHGPVKVRYERNGRCGYLVATTEY